MADLRSSSLRRRAMGEDVDPAVGLLNLADVMLVFACGLMMALIAYWQVDITPQISEMIKDEEVTKVDNLQEAEDLLSSAGSQYNEVGKVYVDPETGTYYMLTEEVENSGVNSGTNQE